MVYKKALFSVVRVFLCAVLVFSVSIPSSLLWAYDSTSASADADYIQKGKDYYNKGKLIEARSMFELALKVDPDNKWARYYIDKIDSKLASFRSVVPRRSAKVENLYKKGKESFLAGRYREASEYFTKVLSFVPNHQYAKRYLEKANERLMSEIQLPKEEGVSDYTFDKDIDLGDNTDPEVLKTRLRLALLTLQREMGDYLGIMRGMEEGQKALMRKYLKEKQKQIDMLKEKIDQQRGLVDSLSLERLKLQTQLARINEEISILQSRLMVSFTDQGYDVDSMDLDDLMRQEARLTAEEKELRNRLKGELAKREALQQQLSAIEDRIRNVKSGQQVSGSSPNYAPPQQLYSQPDKTNRLNAAQPSPEKIGVSVPKRKYTRKDISRLFKEAVSMYRDGLYKQAISAFKAVIEAAPVDSRYVSRSRNYIIEAREALRKRRRLLQSLNSAGSEAARASEQSKAARPGPAGHNWKASPNSRDAMPYDAKAARDKKTKRAEYLQEKLERVMGLLDKGKFDDAESLLIKLLALYPNDERISRLLRETRASREEKEYNLAIEKVRQMIKNGDFKQARGVVASMMERFPKRRKGLNAVLKEVNNLIKRQEFLESVHQKTMAAVEKELKAMPVKAKKGLLPNLMSQINREQALLRNKFFKEQINLARRLISENKFDDAEKVLSQKWEGKYQDEATALLKTIPEKKKKYLAYQKRKKAYNNLISEINSAIEKEDFGLAMKKARILQKRFPKEREAISNLLYKINRGKFLAQYRDIISLLQSMGTSSENLLKAKEIFSNMDRRYAKGREYSELAGKIRQSERDLAAWQKNVESARKNMEKGLQDELKARFKKAWVEQGFLNVVRKEQEERREEYLKATLAKAREMMESWYNWPVAKELLHELINTRYRAVAKRLLLELNQKETERDFYKEIAAVRAALKVYDFEAAREALGRADALIPRHPLIKDLRRNLDEKEKWYKVQQGLKAAQESLGKGDFVGARVILNDLIKNIDPHNVIARRMLSQVDRAEANYYANLKFKEGLAALREGDYQSAIQIAAEGLKWNRYNKDLRTLQRRAKSRWQSEVLRRKNLLNQVEEDARKRHSMYMAYSRSERAKLDFDHKRMLLEADVKSLLNQANRLLSEQKYDRAVALCNKILEYEPGNVEAKRLLDLIVFTKENERKRMKASQKQCPVSGKIAQAGVSANPQVKQQRISNANQKQALADKAKAKGPDKKSTEVDEKKLLAEKENARQELLAKRAAEREKARRLAFLREVDGFVKAKAREQERLDRQAKRAFDGAVLASADKQLNGVIDKAVKEAEAFLADNKFEDARAALAYARAIAPERSRVRSALSKIDRRERSLKLSEEKAAEREKARRLAFLRKVDGFVKAKAREQERLDRQAKRAFDGAVLASADKQLNGVIDKAVKEAEAFLADNKFEDARAALAYARTIAPGHKKVKLAFSNINKAEASFRLAEEREKRHLKLAREKTIKEMQKELAARKKESLSWDAQLRDDIRSEMRNKLALQERQEHLRKVKFAEARRRTMQGVNNFLKQKPVSILKSAAGIASDVSTELSLMAVAQARSQADNLLDSLKYAVESRDLARSKQLLADLAKQPLLSDLQKRRIAEYRVKVGALEEDMLLDKEKYLAGIKNKIKKLKLAEAQETTDGMSKADLVKNLLDDAQNAVLDGNYQKVLRTTEKVLEIDPENQKALSLAERARLMIKLQAKLAEKEAAAQKRMQMRRKKKKVIEGKKQEKHKAKEPKQIKPKTEKDTPVIDVEDEIDALYNKAKSLYSKGSLAMSKELFKDVIAKEQAAGLNNYTVFAKQYLDLVKERQKDIASAKKAAETKGLVDNVINKLFGDASKFVKEGRYASAASVYENILFLEPNNKKAKAKLFEMKDKIYQNVKKQLEEKVEDQDKKMLKQVMEKSAENIDIKKKYVSRKARQKIVKIPEIKKKLQKKISANFQDVPLVDILKFFADQVNINIIPSASVLSQSYTTSIEFKDMTLESALKYLLKSFGLVYQIDEEAIWITTPDEMEKEPMETKVYHLNKGIGLYTKFSTSSSSSVDLGSGAQVSEVKTLKDVLDESVDWPSGSKLVLDERTGTLIVTNSPMNIKKVDEILWNLDVVPLQVLIEAKFLEVDVTDLQELGVEWKLANEDWAVKSKGGSFAQGVAQNSGTDFTDFTHASEGLNLTYKGVLTKPQYEAVVHALEQNQNTRTLSSPRIATMNNQSASIKVVDEWIYPTRYEFQIVQYDLNGDGDYDDAGETRYENVPMDFVKRDVGIILTVTPSVGDDMRTISLSLIPEVSDAVADYFEYTGGVKLPKFTSRNLNTNIVVDNTDTVVLGGLIRESRSKTISKVPILGDLPLFGGLFKKNSDSVNRRNLLIFVTASIIDSQGDAVVASD